MSTVKVLNLKELIETSTKGTHTTYGNDTIAILTGPRGIIVTDNEGIHTIQESIDCTIDYNMVKNDGEFKVMPEFIGNEKLSVLLEHAPISEVPLKAYIRTFGSRIESNYSTLLDSIDIIGIDSSKYNR